jgi:tRNA(fMet)-specific endonuclease VapC
MVGFTQKDAINFGHIRAGLERRRQPIGSYDLLIAAEVLSRSLTLVTNNSGEFSSIDGLDIESWAE